MFSNSSEWWAAMSTMEQVYWIIAVPASLIFVILMVMTFLGGDADSEGDADLESDDGIPYQFITIKNLIGFFTIFSWTGLACIKSGFSVTNTIIFSTSAGVLMMIAMATVFYLMGKLTESGNLNLRNSIGSIAEVYLVIPGKRKSFGKAQLKVQGTFKTIDAITDEEEDIPTGALVNILDVTTNDILIVETSKK